jgi:hypothetical protein
MTTPLSRTLALAIALMTVAALVAQYLTDQRANPELAGYETLWRLARYFTILTNALVVVTYAAIAFGARLTAPVWLGGVTLWIAITGVVYHLLLAGTEAPKTGLDWWANFGLHSATPIAVTLWWLTFAPRAGLGAGAAALWMLWPLIYVAYALARGHLDGTYPYFFTNPDRIGWTGVAEWTVILAVAFLIAGLLLIALARLIRNR